MGFVDLHSHVLYALDDGAPDLDTARGMLLGLGALGFSDVCATPHQKAGQYLPSLEVIDRTYAAVVEMTAGGGFPRLHLAAENMWDDVFYERLQRDAIPSYDGGPAYLFELRPTEQLPPGLAEQLFRQQVAGKVPVMAHPERYQVLWDDDATLEHLRQCCALVVDLGALAGAHGRREAKAARHLVEDRLAHAVASDAHSVADVKVAAEGIAWIRKRCGDGAVRRLLDDGPHAILAGTLPD